jgi:pyruvate,water dikinase
LERQISEAVARLSPNGERLAVRSSAADEDSAGHSFAGQFDSYLFVAPAAVPPKIIAVWRSGFTERVKAYRREHNLPETKRPPAVLVQRMINADVSGVAFGADPVSGRRGIVVIGALYGLGTALVSGECDADTFHVSRDGTILAREIAVKRRAHRFAADSAEGIAAVDIAESEAVKPALNDDQILAVANLVRQTNRHFGRPQDIEWAIENGQLYLLQSRPITSLAQIADPDGALNLWDNSNIIESYSGVTTPLTFSFARNAYENVYRQFCRVMRVPAKTLEDGELVFPRMLGLIRGRVYYNLLNWYRLLAMLPGFKSNRAFMEQMMGVKEGLPETIVAELSRREGGAFQDRVNLLKSASGLVANYFRLPRLIADFYQRLDTALAPTKPQLHEMRPDELVAYYHALERQLLTRWEAPIINDFFAMIFYGVLRKLTQKWCGDTEATLQNDLLSGEGGMISAEPAQRVRSMAQLIADDHSFVDALCDGTFTQIMALMAARPAFQKQYQDYLDKFGDRCLEELKLESSTLHDDPLLLLRAVGQLARSGKTRAALPRHNNDARSQAESRVRKQLRFRPLRRLVFRWVLRNARARVRDRENLRFERTRVFGRVRRIFVELGRRLHALDLLDDPRDVFYLELNELLGFVEGTAARVNLKQLVAISRAEFAAYRAEEPPDDRFETRGIVYQGNPFRKTSVATETSGDERKGIGCCPGIVRGAVRVITDPRNAQLPHGSILVAERTDPGWIMLFPSASGLLVERGSLLSHSAIVAREMRIPAIVSIAGVTRWLKDGDLVELDGSTGVVRKIKQSDKLPACP